MADNPMTDLRDTIEKILYKKVTSFQAVSYEDLTDELLQAFATALDDIKLPEKDNRQFPGLGDTTKDHAEIRETCYQEGYNQALADCQKAVEKFKEGLK